MSDHHLHVTARGWLAAGGGLAMTAVGLLTHYPAMLGFGIALIAATLAAIISVLTPAPLSISRTVNPQRVMRLEECTATISVKNESARVRLSVVGRDLVADRPIEFALPLLAPGASASTEVEIPTDQRGTITFGPLQLDRKSFGDLLRIRSNYGKSAQALVQPRILEAAGLPPGMRRGHSGAEERIAHGGTDLVSLREYVPGDDLRRLHGPTSARYGTLMVREDADPSSPHLTVLLDDLASSYPDPDYFEEAVDTAISLLAAAKAVYSPARLVTASSSIDLELETPIQNSGPAPVDEEALQLLTHARLAPAGAGIRPLDRQPDVLAVIGHAPVPEQDVSDPDAEGVAAEKAWANYLRMAATAPEGVILSIEQNPAALAAASGGAIVLRGPRAEDLTRAWRRVVVR